MAEESLREGELGTGDQAAFAKLVELPPYEPDNAAYDVDVASDPYRRFTEATEAGATIELSLPTVDGRREYIELDNLESKAWIRDPLRERITSANSKIREPGATVAINAPERLAGRGIIGKQVGLRATWGRAKRNSGKSIFGDTRLRWIMYRSAAANGCRSSPALASALARSYQKIVGDQKAEIMMPRLAIRAAHPRRHDALVTTILKALTKSSSSAGCAISTVPAASIEKNRRFCVPMIG